VSGVRLEEGIIIMLIGIKIRKITGVKLPMKEQHHQAASY
jgi:hypothetical protein